VGYIIFPGRLAATCQHRGVERELIRECTSNGRKLALAAGVKFDRKPKLSAYLRAEAIKPSQRRGRPSFARTPWDISMIYSIRSRRRRTSQ
jgi:hypothetical protein